MTPERAAERSVDTLQRIYAVVAGLAINEGFKRVFLAKDGEMHMHYDSLPQLIAFVITAVPFVHGMNRHLDENFTSSKGETGRLMLVQLIVDFFVFIVESALLFVLAVSVGSGIFFFCWWLLLLSVDVVWPCLTFQFKKPAVRNWMLVNFATIVASCLLLCWRAQLPEQVVTWAFALGAIARTAVDYFVSWKFYFPEIKPPVARPPFYPIAVMPPPAPPPIA